MSGTPPSSVGGGGVAGAPPLSGVVASAVGVPVSGNVVGVPTPSVGGASIAAASVASAADHFCLRWNNYQTNMTAVFDQLLQEEVFVDVTLSCDGGAQLRAHKVVLAACSPYFQAVLQNNPCKHPIIILPRDVAFADLRAIIEFVYRGEIDVAQEQINSLLQAADTLKIKGLCEVGEDPANCPPGFTATPSSRPSLSSQSGAQTSTQTYSQSNSGNTPSRGRPPFSRGRYNTAYRPRGRPPLYTRHRFDRPSGSSTRSAPLSRELRRIKTEDVDDDGAGGGISGGNDVSGGDNHHRLHHSHYQSNQHNGQWAGAAAATNHAPPAAHAHHGPPAPQAHPSLPHPPAAHAPPPLPELGPSVVLPPPDETAGTSHGTPDYDAYSYVKTEDHSQSQSHIQDPNDPTGQRMTVTPELLGLMPSNTGSHYSSDSESVSGTPSGRKLWTDEDMEKALDSLRNSAMSLSRAAQVFGIPATTLWQRAHRMGIETPKKEGPNKTWSEHDLAGALEELRSGRLSANRASKEFGIPNSTLYKIARKEGIKLSSPFSGNSAFMES
ncbi:Protein bric-a-brac 2 [Armadillidium nasatum]|uniref:Protein bric-a-brac 2 n=1 Tax=Armadillidium nasatum TaxID=96803 RepID=A0A5N5TBA9_9CRUS|nr:Protein bric-a-brac 2 [Armadillidium nasatum]